LNQTFVLRVTQFSDELLVQDASSLSDFGAITARPHRRRNRRDAWYLHPAGHIDLCSVLLPVRRKAG
jgi:hypothetical protein